MNLEGGYHDEEGYSCLLRLWIEKLFDGKQKGIGTLRIKEVLQYL